MPEPLKVRAVEGRKLPAIDPQGRPIPGRYVAHDKKGLPLGEAVSVPDDTYHRRAVARGDLTLDEG